MATSGRVQSGTFNHGRFYFKWDWVSNNVGGNFSTISWSWGINIDDGGWNWGSNGLKSISGYINGGLVFGANTWSNISKAGGGDVGLLSGSSNIGHNSDGSKNFGISSTGWSIGDGNYSNSGSWDLPTIPRHADVVTFSFDSGGIPFTDEGPIWMDFVNPAGGYIYGIINGPDNARWYTQNGIGSRHYFNMNELGPIIQQKLANTNSMANVKVGITDNIGGVWDDELYPRTVTIKNDQGQANPLFSNFTYLDTNAATVAVTGSDQVLIKGKSTLQVTVPVANKATGRKFATMSTYSTLIGNYNQSSTWSNTVDVVKDVGVVTTDIVGDATTPTLSVRAIDSRGNSATASKTVTVLDYTRPGFSYAVDVRYTNDFDSSNGLTVSGYDGNAIAVISPLPLNGVEKNSIAANGFRYQVSRADQPWLNDWVYPTYTQDPVTGFIRVDTAVMATAILNKMNATGADNTQGWDIWFQATDKLETSDYYAVIDIGRPIMRIGADGWLYHKEEEFSFAFNPTSNAFIPAILGIPGLGGGTWGYEIIAGSPASHSAITNFATKSQNTYFIFENFLSPGIYTMYMWAVRAPDAPALLIYKDGVPMYTATLNNTASEGFDLYSATTTANYRAALTDVYISEPGIYQFAMQAYNKSTASTGYYLRVFGLYFRKTQILV